MKHPSWSTQKIEDEFTHLPVSRQRKWQLRHPEKQRVIRKRFDKSLRRRIYARELGRKKYGWEERYLWAKSYKEEKKIRMAKGGDKKHGKTQRT